MRARRLLLALGLSLAPALLGAQEATGPCELIESQTTNWMELAPGVQQITVFGPLFVRCQGGTELRGDFGVINGMTRELTLNGHVSFIDPTQTLTSDNATYNSQTARLYAYGNVVFTNRAEGSTIRGPELEYFRPQPGVPGREQAIVNAGQRPHLIVRPKQQREGSKPLDIDADRVSIVGQNDLTAIGNVIIKQDSVTSTAAEARYNSGQEHLELRGNARILSKEYTLAGDTINARTREGALEHVHATRAAEMKSERMNVRAPDLQLFFTRDTLQRTVARGGPEPERRAVAEAKAFRLVADSIDAALPNQRLQQVVAVGRARGEAIDTTRADSARAFPLVAAAPRDTAAGARADSARADSVAVDSATLALLKTDWITGDTVTGYFEPRDSAARGAAADTAVTLRRLVAKGTAQSLYKVRPQQEGAPAPDDGRRGINFLSGDVIELTLANGELDVAHVTGLQRGLYLDPIPATTAPPTTPATPDAPAGTAPATTAGTATPPAPRR